MPIPSFTIDGVLPPYVGPDGSSDAAEDMPPYAVSALDVVATLVLAEANDCIVVTDNEKVFADIMIVNPRRTTIR